MPIAYSQCVDANMQSVQRESVGRKTVTREPNGNVMVRFDYRLPNGEHRVLTQTVQQYDPTVSTGRLLEVVADVLEQRANQEVHQFVRQNAQAQRGGQMAQYYRPYWDEIDDIGTADGMYRMNVSVTTTATGCPNCGASGTAGDFGTGTQMPYLDGFVAGQNLAHLAQDAMHNIRLIPVNLKLGKHTLTIMKKLEDGGAIDITQEDIDRAKQEYLGQARIHIITRKAERRAEDLLRTFISEVDFRDYKEKGYFTVKSGDKVFRIHKDSHKHIDMWEKDKDRGIFVPKNRLCVHTERRVCPPADEALTKLLLIRSGQVIDSANLHPIDASMEKELVLV